MAPPADRMKLHTGGLVHPHPSLPIVAHWGAEIGDAERQKIERLAARLREEDPTISATGAFGPGVGAGLGPWPGVFLEDHSWIALFAQRGDVSYSHRALLLAGEGDMVLIGIGRNRRFEAYCRDQLGLGEVQVLTPGGMASRQSLALRAAGDAELLDRLAAVARRAGGLNVVPYMGTGGVWALAGEIAARSATEVRVAAPPPGLTRRVNDKLWFSARVAELLGERSLPKVREAFGLATLSQQLAGLARRYPSVAIKLPDSASSAGNIVMSSDELSGLPLKAVRDDARRRLLQAGWRGGFPLLTSAWEQPVLASPSVQLWIPLPYDGDPVVEGIFDQILHGEAGAFAGAAPSALPPAQQQDLVREAMCLGLLFQALGYFGRCSFDAIVLDPPQGLGELHWIECNGRWGGVSIPMTLANRLLEGWNDTTFIVVERDGLEVRGQTLGIVLEELADELFVPRQRPRGAVILSPSGIEAGTGFEVMVIDRSVEAARTRAQSVADRLLGLMGLSGRRPAP